MQNKKFQDFVATYNIIYKKLQAQQIDENEYIVLVKQKANEIFGTLGAYNELIAYSEGAMRIVYEIDKHTVLKVAKTAFTRVYNEFESDNKIATTFADLLPDVYERAPDYAWIVMERVGIIHDYAKFFDFFPEFDAIDSKVTSYRDKRAVFTSFINYAMLKIKHGSERDFKNLYKVMLNYVMFEISYNQFLFLMKYIDDYKSKLLARLVELCLRVRIEPKEIDIGNVGIDSKGNFVLVDLSLFVTVR